LSHEVEVDGKFLLALAAIDAATARDVQAAGCSRCGAPLDVATYPRKPRGLDGTEELAKAFSFRESFCCRRCRVRTTPPSLRFLGRKEYIAVVVVLTCVVGAAAAAEGVVFEAPRRTVRRWRTWWTRTLPATAFWLEARARFAPSVAETSMPASLLDRFGGATAEGVRGLLRFTRSVTTSSWRRSIPMDG
jgi:hypothetical protein